ncbi:MAG: sodium:solute symporter family protein [Holosporales bacterium]|jgi:SSS family solute:Na+ symporter|nr:sodium:solute symporter family protein [Holosporales bacterium]
MNIHWIDIFIIALFFVATLVAGMLYGKKVSSVKEYLVGSKQFSVSALLMTICVTWFAGENLLGATTEIYLYGCNYFIPCLLAAPISFWILWNVAPKIAKYTRSCTIGDVMGAMFGKPGKVITGILGLVLSIGYISVQIKCMGYVAGYFFDSKMLGIVIGGGLVVFYTAIGGIKSVVFTDIIQFLVLIVAMPIVYMVTINSIGGCSGLMERLPENYFIIPSKEIIADLAIFAVLAVPFIDPAISQRMLMSAPGADIKRPYKILSIVMPLLYFFVAMIGIVIFVRFPNIDPDLAYPHMIDCGLPFIVKGLAIASIFAVLMSTADSYMNVAASSLVYDAMCALTDSQFYQKHSLLLLKIFTFVIGGGALLVALLDLRIVELIIDFCGFWGSVVVIPLYAALFGFITTPLSFIVSSIVGILASIYLKVFAGDMSFWASIPISMAANGIAFFVMHFVQKYYSTYSFLQQVQERRDAMDDAQNIKSRRRFPV